MHYVKSKREKFSICNLCKDEKALSWDHVPPKGGIELTKVEMETVFGLMAGDKENFKLRESQNGVKYRIICKKCNAMLGTKSVHPTKAYFLPTPIIAGFPVLNVCLLLNF